MNKKKKVVLMLLVFLSLVVFCNVYADSDVDKIYKEGLSLAKEGDIESAIVKFKKVIKLNRNFAEAYYCLANCYRITGKGEKSIQELKKAIFLDPKNYFYFLYLGRVYIEQGSYMKAIDQLNKLWEADLQLAKQLEAEIIMTKAQGVDRIEIGKDGSALLEKKISKEKGEAAKLVQQATDLLGNINNDSSEEAKKILDKAIIYSPNYNVPNLLLARVYSNEQKYGKAIDLLEGFLKENPNDSSALHMLGGLYAATNDTELALKTWEKIKNIDPIIYATRKFWIKKIKEGKLIIKN